MATTLCFDFGNTRFKCAVFEKDVFSREVLLEDDSIETIKKLLAQYHPTRSILSSVVKHNVAIEELLQQQTKFHKLSHATKLNFTTPVAKPETIGADRLALAAAAAHFFPKENNLVIALGSCITYNFINQYHELIGGSISPGMEMRFRSMHEHTAFLPQAKPAWNFPVVAYDTTTNLQSGVIAGISFEMDGFIDFYAQKYANFNVVLTGGDADHFARRLKNKVVADNHFLYKGLYAISEINNS